MWRIRQAENMDSFYAYPRRMQYGAGLDSRASVSISSFGATIDLARLREGCAMFRKDLIVSLAVSLIPWLFRH